MNKKMYVAIVLLIVVTKVAFCQETTAGWIKYDKNPVLGGSLGTIFDISVLREEAGFYRMYCSWRPKASIALAKSVDGFTWTNPTVVLSPIATTTWEQDINRPGVIKKDGLYQMWYTGQANGQSWIGYATSKDGTTWTRMSKTPVISPDVPWEKGAVMCPSVIWDEEEGVYKMWYSGGEQYEPDAIGYATSEDGLTWKKYAENPVFQNDPNNTWEQFKVTACQVIKENGEYLMFYIGFRDVDYAQIGMAKSKDGLTGWERHPQNPIIRPGKGWDASAVYKPYAIFDGTKWLLWYNGRNGGTEQIGVATHEGYNLGFPGETLMPDIVSDIYNVWTDGGNLHLKGTGKTAYKVYGMLGTPISEGVFDTALTINNIAQGIYLVLLDNGKDHIVKKVII